MRRLHDVSKRRRKWLNPRCLLHRADHMKPWEYEPWDGRMLGRYYKCPRCRTTLVRMGETPLQPTQELTLLFAPWSRWSVLWEERLIITRQGRQQIAEFLKLGNLTSCERMQLRALRLISEQEQGIAWQAFLARLDALRCSLVEPPLRPAALRGVTFKLVEGAR